MTFITTTPFTRINDRDFFKSKDISSLINSNTPKHYIIDNNANLIDSRYQFTQIQNGFLYACTETVFDYPCTFLSEKSFKGITAKRPFVIFGSVGSIKLIKELGFKTFSNWWDESYDDEPDPEIRFLKAFEIITQVSNMSLDSLKELCIDMQDVLEYNSYYYKNTFFKSELKRFTLELDKLVDV
jgi:hypothetical protein